MAEASDMFCGCFCVQMCSPLSWLLSLALRSEKIIHTWRFPIAAGHWSDPVRDFLGFGASCFVVCLAARSPGGAGIPLLSGPRARRCPVPSCPVSVPGPVPPGQGAPFCLRAAALSVGVTLLVCAYCSRAWRMQLPLGARRVPLPSVAFCVVAVPLGVG